MVRAELDSRAPATTAGSGPPLPATTTAPHTAVTTAPLVSTPGSSAPSLREMLDASPARGHVEHDSASLASRQDDLESDSVASSPIPAGQEARDTPPQDQEREPELTPDERYQRALRAAHEALHGSPPASDEDVDLAKGNTDNHPARAVQAFVTTLLAGQYQWPEREQVLRIDSMTGPRAQDM